MPKKTKGSVKPAPVVEAPKKETPKLTEEQYDKLRSDLEEFQHSSLVILADSENYDVVPTRTEEGYFLRKEHYEVVKQESKKLGLKVLYSYEVGTQTLVLNPTNMRVFVLPNGEVQH